MVTGSLPEASAAWPLAGHAAAVALLQQAIVSDRVGHAYLMTGPTGVGRATLARLFAMTLVCQAGSLSPPAPCGHCRACRLVARGVHPDVEWLSLASQQATSEARGTRNRNITIESIRGLRERLVLRPLEAAWRVAVIDDAETMSGGGGLPAASALLKTLEEPPSFAVIILIAPSADAVLATVRSRCQVIELSLVRRAAIAAYLMGHEGQDESRAAQLAALARGRPGWAVAAARQPELLAERQAALQRALDLIRASAASRLQLADEWAGRLARGDWRQTEAELELLTGCWRDLLLARSGSHDLVVHPEVVRELGRTSEQLGLSQLGAALAATRTGIQQIRQNVNARLALEAMVLAWPAMVDERS